MLSSRTLFPTRQDICNTDADGKENEHCTPCLVGPEWDALRTELGTELIKGYRSSVPTLKYSDWLSQTMATSAFRVLLKVCRCGVMMISLSQACWLRPA